MIRTAKYIAIAAGSLLIIAIGAPLLFWLGRPLRDRHPPGDTVVDAELLADDPGVDIDDLVVLS